MPIYKRKGKPGVWLVRLQRNGRPATWVVRGSREDAAREEARRRLEAELSAPTFSAFCVEAYKPHAKLRLKGSSWKKQLYHLATLVVHLGNLRLDQITTASIEEFARARLDEGGVNPLRATTVNNEIRALKRVLSFAVERGRLAAVPKFRALPERGGRRVKAWSSAELGALLAAVAKESPYILPVVMFLANTGCRKGEAIALTWEHVDLGARLIKIWPSEEWQPKNGQPREIPISDALLPWLARQKDGTKGRWVFPARTGGRWAEWPQLQFDRARAAAKLKGGPHTLRHTYATHFLASVPDLYLLARILGHSDAAVTRLYAHLLPDHLARARNAVQVVAPVGVAEAFANVRWAPERRRSSR